MSSSNSKQQSSTTSKSVTLQDTEGLTIAGNEGTVNVTDGGAIQGSFDLAGMTIEKAAALTLGLVGAQAAASQSAFDFANTAATRAQDFAMSAGRSDIALIQQGGKGLIVLVGIVAAAYVVTKWGKA